MKTDWKARLSALAVWFSYDTRLGRKMTQKKIARELNLAGVRPDPATAGNFPPPPGW